MFGAASFGLLAWSRRRTIVVLLVSLLMLPVAMAAMLVEAQREQPAGLQLPLQHGILTQPFGCTALEIEPWSAACPSHHFHSGIDLAGELDSPVFAASEGTALVARERGGYGLYMLIERDARLATLYGHLDLPLVKSGDHVLKGQAIGLMGSSGNSTGPHLHFEIRLAGLPVDPLPLLPAAEGGDR